MAAVKDRYVDKMETSRSAVQRSCFSFHPQSRERGPVFVSDIPLVGGPQHFGLSGHTRHLACQGTDSVSKPFPGLNRKLTPDKHPPLPQGPFWTLPVPLRPPCSVAVPSSSAFHSPVILASFGIFSSRSCMNVFQKTSCTEP